MGKTVDVAELIKKIKQTTDQTLEKNTKKNEQLVNENNNKIIKCCFTCKHGYTRENCLCLKKSAI